NTQGGIQFLLTGLKGQFAETHDQLTAFASGLSDEQVFDRRVPQATFPSYDKLDRGSFGIEDGTINNPLGELRFLADNILSRINEIKFDSDSQDLKEEALFFGNFFGGIARSWYASYMGLEPDKGGGIIDNGPFIPANEMYGQSLTKLEESLKYATAYQEKVVKSAIARIFLYKGEYGKAKNAAEKGLKKGDEAFISQHSIQSANEWYFFAGNDRVQFRVDQRFVDYVEN